MKQEQENKSINDVMQKNIKNLRDYIEVSKDNRILFYVLIYYKLIY